MASSVKYHKTYLKLHSEYEKYAYPLIKKALDQQIDAVLKFTDETNFDDLEVYLQFIVHQKPLYDALEKIYAKVGVSSATFSYDWIRNSVPKNKKDFIIDFFNAEWFAEMVEYFRFIGTNKVAGIDETTRDKIQNVLADILGQNLSRREQARLFEETLSSPDFNRARSLVIARTESTTAANYGIQMGAESSDYEVVKFWINTKDKRTRRSHLAMTTERIGINQPFNVGGTLMMYPGDPGNQFNVIPAAEVVNCRCVMATEALLDSDGLPVLKPRTPPYLAGSNTANLPKIPKPVIQEIEPIKPSKTFTEANTLKEAKQQALQIINENTSVNFTKLKVASDVDLQQLNNLNRQLFKLTTNYNLAPNYNKLSEARLSFASTKRYYGMVKTTYGGQINEVNFGSNKPFGRSIDARTKGGFYQNEFGSYQFAPKSQVDKENVKLATITHEFAHFISVRNKNVMAQFPKLNEYWQEIEVLNKQYKQEISKYNQEKNFKMLNETYLGDYASTNLDEFVAEAFTEYQLKTKPSKYALEVGKIIDKYFKK